MELKEFADLGFSLAEQLDQLANEFYFKDSNHDYWNIYAGDVREKAKEVLNLLSNTEVLEKLESSTLLSRATKLPYLATVEERTNQFERLYEAFVDFAHAEESWETHFAANRLKYVEIWEESKRWEQGFQEKQRIAAEAVRLREERRLIQHAEALAFAKEKFSKPARQAPCFAETRKNGLNCARSDLVEIKKLPTYFSADKKIDISITRCSRCWQLYKECFVVDELTKQFRSHFLKPNETDAERVFHFSIAEAEEYDKIDFRVLVNPNLKAATAESRPSRAAEQVKNQFGPLPKDDSKPTPSQSGQAPPGGVTAAPGDSFIPVGIPHRTLCDIEMLIYDYDAMGVKTEVLPVDSIFQPWEPELRRGREVPITIGDQAAEFDWAVSSFEGHFLKWDDFFSRCRMIEPESNDSGS